MKWFPLLTLLILVGCNDVSRRAHFPSASVNPLKVEPINFGNLPSRTIVHMDPRVKIDIERREIEITGQSGSLCGIDFKLGQIIRYDLLNDNELELMLETETLKLTRIHQSIHNGVYGDWQSASFTEDASSNRERIVSFFIRDSKVMEVDVYCEQKSGKLIEEF